MNRADPLRRRRSRLFRLEAVPALCIAWLLVLRLLARLFGGIADPGPALARSDLLPAPVLAQAQAVGRTVDAMSIRLPWHSTCLVRCVAGRMCWHAGGSPGISCSAAICIMET